MRVELPQLGRGLTSYGAPPSSSLKGALRISANNSIASSLSVSVETAVGVHAWNPIWFSVNSLWHSVASGLEEAQRRP